MRIWRVLAVVVVVLAPAVLFLAVRGAEVAVVLEVGVIAMRLVAAVRGGRAVGAVR